MHAQITMIISCQFFFSYQFVISCLDYCNALFYGITDELTVNCSQFRTLPPGSWRTPGDMIISHLCSASCTGFLCGSTSCLKLRLSSTCQLVADARVRQLRSADTRTLVVSRTRSSFGDRTFAAAGPQIWNSLPPNLRLCGLSSGQFRRLLKTSLFVQWGHGAVWTLTAPYRNILTYLLS